MHIAGITTANDFYLPGYNSQQGGSHKNIDTSLYPGVRIISRTHNCLNFSCSEDVSYDVLDRLWDETSYMIIQDNDDIDSYFQDNRIANDPYFYQDNSSINTIFQSNQRDHIMDNNLQDRS